MGPSGLHTSERRDNWLLSVRYGEGEGDRTIKIISGDSTGGTITISELTAGTVYLIQVSAMGQPGIGVYSDPITFETPHEC